MMDFRDDPNLILAYVEGELPDADVARFEKRCADDAALADLVRDLKRDRSALRALPPSRPETSPTDHALAHIERQLLLGERSAAAAHRASGPTGNRSVFRFARYAAYGSLAAALLLTSAVVINNLTGTPLADRAHELAAVPPGSTVQDDRLATLEPDLATDGMSDIVPATSARALSDSLALAAEDHAAKEPATPTSDNLTRVRVLRPAASNEAMEIPSFDNAGALLEQQDGALAESKAYPLPHTASVIAHDPGHDISSTLGPWEDANNPVLLEFGRLGVGVPPDKRQTDPQTLSFFNIVPDPEQSPSESAPHSPAMMAGPDSNAAAKLREALAIEALASSSIRSDAKTPQRQPHPAESAPTPSQQVPKAGLPLWLDPGYWLGPVWDAGHAPPSIDGAGSEH